MVFGSLKDRWMSSTFVDSALPGSHALVSFDSAPVSLPASGPATKKTATQKRMIRYFALRPVMMLAADLVTALLPCLVSCARGRRPLTGARGPTSWCVVRAWCGALVLWRDGSSGRTTP